MTIDERIEALTRSVKSLSQMHRNNQKAYSKLAIRLAKILDAQQRREKS